MNLTNYFINTEMVKYTYKTVAYVLPESIKKMNNDVRLQRAQGKKEDIKNELNNVDNKINDIDNKIKKAKTKNEKIQLENQKKEHENRKNELSNELNTINNTIFDIKADLYGSTVNFNNSNIRNLSANINDIKSVIKDTSKLNDSIVKSISEILTNQIKVNNIFDKDNFKDFLESIKNNVDPTRKFNYPEEFDKLSKALEQFKNSLKTNEENSEIWKSIKTSVENLIPTDKLNNIINNYTEKINDIISLKTNLAKRIFNKEIDDVSDKDLNNYIKNFNLLNDLYNDAEPVINNRELGDLANPQIYSKLKIPNQEHFVRVLNNLREWFSKDGEFNKEILKNKISNELFISNMNTEKLWDENIKDIDPKIIKEAELLIYDIIDYDGNNPSSNRYKGKNKGKNKDEEINEININKNENKDEEININKNEEINLNQNEDEEVENQTYRRYKKKNNNNNNNNRYKKSKSKPKGKGLDLDEIQQMNVMNDIIDYMNNINETLKEIKKSLSNQNTPQKLGRFKVEKYNPNMSITEFKKLFDKK